MERGASTASLNQVRQLTEKPASSRHAHIGRAPEGLRTSAWRPSAVATARYTSRCASSSSQDISAASSWRPPAPSTPGRGAAFSSFRSGPGPRAADALTADAPAGSPEALLRRCSAAADPMRSSSARKASPGSARAPPPPASMDRERRPGAGPGAGPGAASAAPAEAKSYAERIHDGTGGLPPCPCARAARVAVTDVGPECRL